MQELQWFGVPGVLVVLIAALLWGLQRDPRRRAVVAAAEQEIASDDPLPAIPQDRPFQHLSSSVFQDRRYLCSLFGPDTPDLVIAFWTDGDDDRPRVSSFRQLYLPADDGLQAFSHALETEFFEGVTDQGVPDRSRLVVAYTFCWLPGLGQDLVVESRFREDHFEHRHYLADSDGKLKRERLREDSLVQDLFQPDWVEYRQLLGTVRSTEAGEQIRWFESWTANPTARPNAHAWVAHLGLQSGWTPAAVASRLAICDEWHPNHLLGRLIRARSKPGQGGLLTVVDRLKADISLHSDREAQTTFLISQALRTLDQSAAARRLCEALLIEWPRHPGATCLLRLIDQNERGAQT